MLNHIDLQGRFTADPELRHTQSGKACASFSLACERDYKGQDGSRATDFVNCVAWGQTAEFISRTFTKGRMVIVSGRIAQNRFTTKGGENRSTIEIIADNIYFADSVKNAQSAENPAQNEFYDMPDNGDLPF
jgi:single-strand DNA-binding protein